MLQVSPKINHIADEETTSADEFDWTPDRTHSNQQEINSLRTRSSNGQPLYTKTIFVKDQPIQFIVDTGSPVTKLPTVKFNKITTIRPATEYYRDVNDIKIKFEGKTTANIKIDSVKKQLKLLITTKPTHPLLGLTWMGWESWASR